MKLLIQKSHISFEKKFCSRIFLRFLTHRSKLLGSIYTTRSLSAKLSGDQLRAIICYQGKWKFKIEYNVSSIIRKCLFGKKRGGRYHSPITQRSFPCHTSQSSFPCHSNYTRPRHRNQGQRFTKIGQMEKCSCRCSFHFVFLKHFDNCYEVKTEIM